MLFGCNFIAGASDVQSGSQEAELRRHWWGWAFTTCGVIAIVHCASRHQRSDSPSQRRRSPLEL